MKTNARIFQLLTALSLWMAGCTAPTPAATQPPSPPAQIEPSPTPQPTATPAPTPIPFEPMFRGGLERRGSVEQPGPAAEWIGEQRSPVGTSPVLAEGGLLTGEQDGVVRLLDLATGEPRWVFQADAGIAHSLTVFDGTAFFGTDKGSFYAIYARDGSLKWQAATGGQIIATAAVNQGLAYVGSTDGSLYAFDLETGKERWKFATQAMIVSSPAVIDGLVLFGSGDQVFYALDAATGKPAWKFAAKAPIFSSPAVSNGVIFFGSEDGTGYVLDLKTGKEVHKFQAEGSLTATPVVADGTLYVATTGGKVYALDLAKRELLWTYAVKEPIISSPAVAGGAVYFGALDGRFYAVDAATGQELWRFQTEGEVWCSPLVAGDFVYFGSYDGRYYALDRRGPKVALAPEPTALPLEPTPTMLPEPKTAVAQGSNGLPWWNDRVFYEVFVRSFQDSNGDGMGDLQGLISRLDYLNDGDPQTKTDLGVTGLWLMPVSESPSYHGYDTVDYQKIEQDYGTNEDFKQLIAAAHERGMIVIVDLVMNHVSNQHPWFTAAAQGDPQYENYFIWSDENPGFLSPWDSPVWHRLGLRYYYGLFWEGMPDLNYNNGAVTEAMFDNLRFWLEDMGADGFRLDAVRHLIEDGPVQENTPETHTWLQNFHRYVRSLNPQAFTVGEAWTTPDKILDYVGDEVDVAFEFELANSILESVWRSNSYGLVQTEKKILDLYPPGQYATFLSNHDQNRAMAQAMGDPDGVKVAATILFTHPGIPFIYYGEEVGMRAVRPPDEQVRTPMQWEDAPGAGFTTGEPWFPIGSNVKDFNVAEEDADPASLLNHYRTLIRLRQDHPALRSGEMTLVESTSRQVFAFLRQGEGEILLVVVNLGKEAISDYQLSLAAGPLAGPLQAQVLLGAGRPAAPAATGAGGFEGYRPLPTLPPRSSLIIRLK